MGTSPSLKNAVDKYVASRKLLQESGEITRHHRRDIERTLTGLVDTIGPARTVAGLASEYYAHGVPTLRRPTAPIRFAPTLPVSGLF